MPKKKRPDEKPEKQFERFLETAKEHEVEDAGKVAERAFGRLAKAKFRRDTAPSDTKK